MPRCLRNNVSAGNQQKMPIRAPIAGQICNQAHDPPDATPGPDPGPGRGRTNEWVSDPGMVASGCVGRRVGLGPGLGLGLGFGVPSESANLPSAVGRGRMCGFAGFVCPHIRPLLPPCALNGFERSKPFKAHPPNRDRLRGHTNPFKAHRTFTACTHRQGPALRDWSPHGQDYSGTRDQGSRKGRSALEREPRFLADSARGPADRMDSAFRWRHGWPSKRGGLFCPSLATQVAKHVRRARLVRR